MIRAIFFTVLFASFIVVGSTTSVWAAQMDAKINPNSESSPFKISYQKTVVIEYPNGGDVFDELRGKEWLVEGTADSANPGVKELMSKLNKKIASDGSRAQISDLNVSYNFHLKARNDYTSIDYHVVLEGTLVDYVITHVVTSDSQKTLVDLAWRGMTVNDNVVINGVEINFPINLIKDEEPEVYAILAGTEAEEILRKNLINADFILKQPLTNWHFLFDPTGITADAKTFGLSSEIAGFVVSSWTMGESSFREGIQIERIFEADIMLDQPYIVRSVQSSDQANLYTIGFGVLDMFDGIEIAGVTPTPPKGYGIDPTGKFPIMIVYGMAGLAAVAGIAFFFVSSRSLKNQPQGQQGIDPKNLIGYQTSASSGGYQTNRGEAQLKDDSDYQQTRNVYDGTLQPNTGTPPPQTASQSTEDAACGCAASTEIGSECDCNMQGSCLCDAACQCSADICKEQVRQMS